MKILIYFNKQEISDRGGPSGYLYNLLRNYEGNEIQLLDYPTMNSGFLKKVYLKLPNFVKQFYRLLHNIKLIKDLKKGDHYKNLDFSQFDIIHFNECFSLYKERKFLRNYKGIIVLTNHTPSAPKVEIMDTFLTGFEKKLLRKKRSIFFDELFKYAFLKADYICYPTKFSDEAYFKERPEYKKIIENKKIIYLLTGITEKGYKLSREEFRKKYNISQQSFVISYVGRHLETKGYDVLKEVFNTFKNQKKFTFLIGGKEYPLKGYKNEKNRIEVGRTNDAGSLIHSSDVFILPNKETYFDIVLLEVLSLGVPIICSFTGGNKYFYGLSKGILFYKTTEELIDKISYVSNLNKKELENMGQDNRKLYDSRFTNSVFVHDYLDLMRSLLKYEK